MIAINIDPILLSLGHFALRWYGLNVATAMIVGIWVARRDAKRKGLSDYRFADAIPWVIVGGLIGARFFHVIDYWPDEYAANPLPRTLRLGRRSGDLGRRHRWIGCPGALRLAARAIPGCAYGHGGPRTDVGARASPMAASCSMTPTPRCSLMSPTSACRWSSYRDCIHTPPNGGAKTGRIPVAAG